MILLSTIIYANDLGYAVKFKKELTQYRITCIHINSNTSSSSILPLDHLTDQKVVAVIHFNINRHQKKFYKDDTSKSSSR